VLKGVPEKNISVVEEKKKRRRVGEYDV